MSALYALRYAPSVLKTDIPSIPKNMLPRIQEAIESKLLQNPISFGKPLQHNLKGHRRLRVGNWRIIYRILEDPPTVHIVIIDHRKDVYDS